VRRVRHDRQAAWVCFRGGSVSGREPRADRRHGPFRARGRGVPIVAASWRGDEDASD
jgi:hypothetical protein